MTDESTFSRLPQQALYADLLSSAVFAAFVLLGGTVLVLSLVFSVERPLFLVLGAACLYCIFLVWCFGWPILSHRRTSYSVSDEGLEIRRGVLWRSHHRVPRSRIQHGDVSQGPFQRPLGIGKLSVFTAGSARHTTTLQGVEIERAYRLRDQLLESGDSGREEPPEPSPASSQSFDSARASENPPAAGIEPFGIEPVGPIAPIDPSPER